MASVAKGQVGEDEPDSGKRYETLVIYNQRNIAENHERGNENCPACCKGTEKCGCGGLLHSFNCGMQMFPNTPEYEQYRDSYHMVICDTCALSVLNA